MNKTVRWIMTVLIAAVATVTLGPEAGPSVALARGGGGGGGGSRGSRGSRGSNRGGSSRGGGGRSGRGSRTSGNNKKFKDRWDYLLYLQRQEADDLRPDFIFEARNDSLILERDKEREDDLARQREKAAGDRRADTQAGTTPL